MLYSVEQKPDILPRSRRSLQILEEVARLGAPATPTEINRAIGLPKQTLHRIVASLEEEGFLQRDHDGRTYSPGNRLRALATGVISSTRIRSARLAVMNALAEDVGETCNLVVPDRHSMIYLDRVETAWPLRIQLPVGSRVPFHCTASGKLYLSTMKPARLRQILKRGDFKKYTERSIVDPEVLADAIKQICLDGYSYDNEEFIEGMIALAVPILDQHKRLFASLAFHAPTPRMSLEMAFTHLSRLREAADELTSIISDG